MSANHTILYAGDTRLDAAGSYLAGILTHAGLRFDYLASDEPAPSDAVYDLYLISDYPVNNWPEESLEKLARHVAAGAGLVMIGGWESFHGAAGEYHQSPLAEVLPVRMAPGDDREQSRRPWVLLPNREHPIIDPLPFDRPPTVGGFNRFAVKPDASEILSARPIEIEADGAEVNLLAGEPAAMLAVGNHGQGRVAALATDVAPHWVGTFVDWGRPRIAAQAPGAQAVEVGCHYAEFFTRLVRWALGAL